MTQHHINFRVEYIANPDGSLRIIWSDCNAVAGPPPSAWRDCVTDPPHTNNVVLVWNRDEYCLASLNRDFASLNKDCDCWTSEEGYECFPTHWCDLPERPSDE